MVQAVVPASGCIFCGRPTPERKWTGGTHPYEWRRDVLCGDCETSLENVAAFGGITFTAAYSRYIALSRATPSVPAADLPSAPPRQPDCQPA